MTQHEKILNYIKKHGSITVRKIQESEFFGGLGINNGSARMSELDNKYHFNKETIYKTKKDGTTTHWKVYSFSKHSLEILKKERVE